MAHPKVIDWSKTLQDIDIKAESEVNVVTQ